MAGLRAIKLLPSPYPPQLTGQTMGVTASRFIRAAESADAICAAAGRVSSSRRNFVECVTNEPRRESILTGPPPKGFDMTTGAPLSDKHEVFTTLRPSLLAVAYHMLGNTADAEDMVQESFLRWGKTDDSQVRAPKAFLTTVVTRL